VAEVAREVVALPEVGELLVDEVAEEVVWTEMLAVAAGVAAGSRAEVVAVVVATRVARVAGEVADKTSPCSACKRSRVQPTSCRPLILPRGSSVVGRGSTSATLVPA